MEQSIRRLCLITCGILFYAIIIILIIRHQIIDGNGIQVEIDDIEIVDNGPSINIPLLYWTTATTADINATIESTHDENIFATNYSMALVPKKKWTVNMWQSKCITGKLSLPIATVYVAQSDTLNCDRFFTCSQLVCDLQKDDMFPYGDIQYNFVITGQGSIFEGLSWGCKVHNRTIANNTILVLLTGQYVVSGDHVNDKQYRSLELFLQYNVMAKTLSSTYWLAPVCCIVPGNNPNKLLYWHLAANFPRFYYLCYNSKQCRNA